MQRAKVAAEPTDLRLYAVLEETAALLRDGHASLDADDALYRALDSVEALRTPPVEEAATSETPEYGDFPVADAVAAHHLSEELTKDATLMRWGWLEEGVGYLQVKAMWLYADLDIPDAVSQELGFVSAYAKTAAGLSAAELIDAEAAGARALLARVFADLNGARAIVVDVRFNGGGQDAVAFELLRRLGPGRTHVTNRRLRDGDGWTSTQRLYVDGLATAAVPTVVLVSPQTGSAAEVFAAGAGAMAHVTLVGSATEGAVSSTLDKTLPNGWDFTLSNEVYMDADGRPLEYSGVPIDVELGYPRDRQHFFASVVEDLDGDRLAVLRTIALLGE